MTTLAHVQLDGVTCSQIPDSDRPEPLLGLLHHLKRQLEIPDPQHDVSRYFSPEWSAQSRFRAMMDQVIERENFTSPFSQQWLMRTRLWRSHQPN